MTIDLGARIICYILLGVISALTWHEEDSDEWAPGLFIGVVVLWPVVYVLEALAWCKDRG